jgi:hypothetical protein
VLPTFLRVGAVKREARIVKWVCACLLPASWVVMATGGRHTPSVMRYERGSTWRLFSLFLFFFFCDKPRKEINTWLLPIFIKQLWNFYNYEQDTSVSLFCLWHRANQLYENPWIQM